MPGQLQQLAARSKATLTNYLLHKPRHHMFSTEPARRSIFNIFEMSSTFSKCDAMSVESRFFVFTSRNSYRLEATTYQRGLNPLFLSTS